MAMDELQELKLAELPQLKEAPPSERTRLLLQKLNLCSKVYDFSSTTSVQTREKEAKTKALTEMIEYISNTKNSCTPKVIAQVLETFGLNAFRPLEPKCKASDDDPTPKGGEDSEEPVLEESWHHLKLVYELLLQVVLSKDVTADHVKALFKPRFLVQFLNMFDTNDPRERDYLKTILHRIYGKSMGLRGFVRQAINDLFFTVVYETNRFRGINELLEILGSIINGFALPLKPEHQRFLNRTLIPLHKVSGINKFHQQLTYCVVQYIKKDATTAVPIVLGLLRYWPVTTHDKEILFLNELEEILELIQAEDFPKIMKPLFYQLARSMASQHFQVSQRALNFFNNDHIRLPMAMHRVELLPLVFGALYENCEQHWHAQVKTISFNALRHFIKLDSQLFDQCAAHYEKQQGRKQQESERRQRNWRKLEKSLNLSSIALPPGAPHSLAA